MNVTHEFDTIAAISTPIGTGAVGIIRMSGSKSFKIIKKIFSNPKKLRAGKITHGKILDNESVVDDVIVLQFKNPKSYTGEDVVEIHCHGGINIVKNVLEVVLKNGARLAERGEFTKRAFLNKKMDLSQAEAVMDLIQAKTKEFANYSLKNLSGMLSDNIKGISAIIFVLLSEITASIDFPEEVNELEYDYIINEIQKFIKKIDKILSSATSVNILRQGIKVAIAGKPNVGKSSLFNKLINMDRAIVTDIAGTTRDVLIETLDWDIPVTLYDTAGIRETKDTDKVEEIGIEYSKQSLDDADLVLFVYDAQTGMDDDDDKILDYIKDKKRIVVGNKVDLLQHYNNYALYISTVTGEGLEELKNRIKKFAGEFSSEDVEFITNSRQQDCLRKCRESLVLALEGAKQKVPQDLISIDLKAALLCLDELTGEVVTDDILDNIFSKFCIGK